MKKIRCIDCANCINLFIDYHGYLNNDCKDCGVIFNSLEKWDCKDFKSIGVKAKVCRIKGSSK